jgi:CubicO group peptidase (beta-lactamase class C family)
MQLVEQGKLRLDDPVSKYLPAFANLTVASTQGGEPTPAKNVMTVEHLFTMTGGLNYNSNTPHAKAVKENPQASTLELVNAFAKAPLDMTVSVTDTEPSSFQRLMTSIPIAAPRALVTL